ncbi:MFS transporter [Lactobacillus sp. ESL0731]|uniref:MFS transporter n=1 Tax=unclassified Lactobacillus TaxID=2620435 RepID=UPI0023F88836|nr:MULTISPECIES: MFS transporter [unclassified Lactobacillus]WEV50632.1 MFS transporter [Lactobacillus sp. ESL0700]WEV61762.1 MFS transporter [Lactobacillus sp. ESL0731]
MKNKNLNNKRKLLLGYAVSGLGDQFYTFAVPLLMLTINHSSVTMGLLSAMEYLPTALFGLVIGSLFDVYRKKDVMLTALVMQMLLALLVPIMINKQLPLWSILAVIFVFGFFDLLSWVGYQTLIAQNLSPQDLAQISGSVGLISSIQRMFGPGIASLIINLVGYLTGFLLDSVSFFYLAIIIKDVPEEKAPAKTKNVANKTVAGLKFIWHDVRLKWLIASFLAANLGFQVVVPMLTFILKQTLKGSVTEISLFYTIASVAGIAANFIYLRFNQKISVGQQLLVSGLIILAGFSVMLLLRSFWLVTGGYVLVSIGSVWSQANFFTIVQALTEKQFRGIVTSASTTLTRIMGPIMSLISGLLVKLNAHLIFAVAIGAMIISIYIMFQKRLLKLTLS